MNFYSIASGSKGNATLIENEGRFLLLDMGVTWTCLNKALKALNLNIYNVEALLLTHGHSDHTKGVQYLPPLPIYCTKDTYDCSSVNVIIPFEPFEVIGLKITPILASHDFNDTVGYIFENQNEKFVYLTDTGYIPDKSLSYMKNADYYMIESNHNLKMLYKSHRPITLKERIASDVGHLSNEDSACYMIELIGDKTKQIVLAHLSEECNTSELALETYKKKLHKAHIDVSKLEIITAKQREMVIGGKQK